VLRALREARGITQGGWAAQLGYGRATVRRWEAGATVPSADAEAALIALVREKGLFRRFTDGPLTGVTVNPEWIADLLASARLDGHSGPSTMEPPAVPGPPPVRYALSGDVAIAYQVFGDGPHDLVVTPGAISHREIEWEYPGAVRFFTALSDAARVIVFDKRGTGMSDRVSAGTLEERVDDIRAVMDAEGVKSAVLFGSSEGGPMSILFAATYPERTRSLVLYGAFATDREQATPPSEPSPEEVHAEVERLRQVWGTTGSSLLDLFGPSAAGDPEQREWWARYLRMSASPGAVVALNRMNAEIDVRHVLASLSMPVLVIHRSGDRVINVAEGRHLARQIRGAQFVELPGDDHLPWIGDVDSITSLVAGFVRRTPDVREVDRVLASILVVRIVDAPADRSMASSLALIRRELAHYRGREMHCEDDVILTAFDGPTRAVRCAVAILAALRANGLDVACGVHTGELELRVGSAAGGAIDAALDIARIARPGEVLVSRTVTDLVAGSQLQFAPYDRQHQAGPSSRWPLFRVASGFDR
jgi:pimeloyl-ACP methyl ester carboxylesterase